MSGPSNWLFICVFRYCASDTDSDRLWWPTTTTLLYPYLSSQCSVCRVTEWTWGQCYWTICWRCPQSWTWQRLHCKL